MPVTLKVANHDARPVKHDGQTLPHALLRESWGESDPWTNRFGSIIQTSFDDRKVKDLPKVIPRRNGFVETLLKAYGEHHNLVIRPDDVWAAILTQFNFYVNAHAEDLHKHFVAHEGKKYLQIDSPSGDRYTWDFGDLAKRMALLIHQNVVDDTLVDWVLPDFSTTTHNDTVVAAILLMSTLKAYFDYGFGIECGIPSVTLDGEKADWENILTRLDKLEQFGDEPATWAELLRPILRRFIKAFDGEVDTDFWSKIAHVNEPWCGAEHLSGWITAFCVWTEEGKWTGPPKDKNRKVNYPMATQREQLVLDGVGYHYISTSGIPVGFCEVPVKVVDGIETMCTMVAGHMGTYLEGENSDTFRPVSAWFMFIKPQDMPALAGQVPLLLRIPRDVVPSNQLESKNSGWKRSLNYLRTKVIRKK